MSVLRACLVAAGGCLDCRTPDTIVWIAQGDIIIMRNTVRIYLASTFGDCCAERDYLAREVMPRLQHYWEERDTLVSLVDLRAAAPVEESAEEDIMSMGLDAIDDCRPFFICTLAGRYGWVPDEIPDHLIDQHVWLDSCRGYSVTAFEILYSSLDDDSSTGTFFYFRDPAVTAAMSVDEPDVYRERSGSDRERKLIALKKAIPDAGFEPRIYGGRWDPEQNRLIALEEFGDLVYADLMKSISEVFPEPDV